MKKIAIILLLSVIATTAMAQKTLSGTILSKTDGQPVEMATVRLFAFPKLNMPAPPPGAPGMPAPANMPDSIMVQGAQTYYDGLFILSNIRYHRFMINFYVSLTHHVRIYRRIFRTG